MSVASRTLQILDFSDRVVGLFCKLIGNTGLDPELDTEQIHCNQLEKYD